MPAALAGWSDQVMVLTVVFKPKYTITNQILKNLLAIEKLKAQIEKARILPKDELKLRQEAIISMVHHSTGIEGNTLNKYEVEQVMAGRRVSALRREIYEVKNYQKALRYISDLKEQSKSPAVSSILKIHQLTTKNILDKKECGRFRKTPVYVVSRRLGQMVKILYTGPKAKQVPELVKNLIQWIRQAKKQEISPIITAGIAHVELAAIHPFTDGNGRTARLLATLILYSYGYDFRKLFALEEYYNQDRSAYYKAIHLGKNYTERKRADMTGWLEYFVQGFKVSMQDVIDKIEPLILAKPAADLDKIYLNKKERAVLDFIINQGKIYRSDVEEIASLSESSALRLLEQLREKGLISKQGKGRNSFYTLRS